MKPTNLFHILLLLLSFSAISCQSDDGLPVYEDGTNQYVNQWTYEQMKKYYYWSDSMPNKTDLSLNPKDYFEKLLNPNDPFSYTLNPSLPETAPQNLRKRFGFDIAFVQHQGQSFGVILYVLSNSPAQNNGLRRGQFITAIDGTLLTHGNFDTLYRKLVNSTIAQLQLVDYSGQTGFSSPKEVAILQGFTFSQPMPYHIFQMQNHKVGYVEISHFDVGDAQSFMQIFQQFKSQSINELIIDLRYNGGGDISSATALSILIAPNIQANDLFIEYEGNRNGGDIDQTFQEALEMNESQLSFTSLRSAHPALQKVYVLCGSHTASASEIIINNLKPFMQVITIGKKTVGKDVAGFPITDDRIPGQQGWVLYPSIYKLFNADHQGSYSDGINPSLEVDEISELEIFPLGDQRESLLKKALNTIE